MRGTRHATFVAVGAVMLRRLRDIVAILAALASIVGLSRPEVYRDPELISAAWRPNDAVTLLVAVPLLLWASGRARNGSVRGRLVELGALHYLLYDYAFYLFGAELNVLFLVYAAIVTCSGWAIVLALREIDLGTVPRHRARGVAAWLLFVAAGLTATWIAQWTVAMTRTTAPGRFDVTPEFIRVVAAVDLTMMVGLLVPAAMLLRRRKVWGTVLGTMLGVSGALYNLVLAGGTIVQIRHGLAGARPMLALWIGLATGSAIATYRLLRRPAVCFAEST